MKKLLFGCALAVSAFVMPTASAQDWNYSQSCDPCCYDEASFDGFYIGGNLGVHTHEAHRNDFDSHNANGSFSAKETDFTIGLQLGYDWMCGSRVLGLVVDWNWIDNDHKNHFGDLGYSSHKADWFTTIRARMGMNVCDSLFYITAGAAVIGNDNTWNNGTDKFRYDDCRWGWVGGVGAEFQLCGCWTWGVELLSMHFSNDTKSFQTAGTAPETRRFGLSDNTWVARFLVNYRFGDLCGCLF